MAACLSEVKFCLELLFCCWLRPGWGDGPLLEETNPRVEKIDKIARGVLCLRCKKGFENTTHCSFHIASDGTKHHYHTYCAQEGKRCQGKFTVTVGCAVDGCCIETTENQIVLIDRDSVEGLY